MARGGINKRLVKEARNALLAKGQNPSIDTVRVELGNTGSKTTIHRYLKELEEVEGTRLDDEALLSDTIKEMVASLASTLHAEAKAIVKGAEELHEKQQLEWQDLDEMQKQSIEEAEGRIATIGKERTDLERQLSVATEELQQSAIKNQRIEQQLIDLMALSNEKDKRIQSLEEKHLHARNATEHYRQSVKEQRDQDQRRHEQQVQLLQAEQRQLSQTLSIKHSEITELNKENARFVTEVSEARKQIPPLNMKIQALEKQLKVVEMSVATLKVQHSELQTFAHKQSETLVTVTAQLAETEKTRLGLNIEIASLTSELDVKNELFDKISIASEIKADIE